MKKLLFALLLVRQPSKSTLIRFDAALSSQSLVKAITSIFCGESRLSLGLSSSDEKPWQQNFPSRGLRNFPESADQKFQFRAKQQRVVGDLMLGCNLGCKVFLDDFSLWFDSQSTLPVKLSRFTSLKLFLLRKIEEQFSLAVEAVKKKLLKRSEEILFFQGKAALISWVCFLLIESLCHTAKKFFDSLSVELSLLKEEPAYYQVRLELYKQKDGLLNLLEKIKSLGRCFSAFPVKVLVGGFQPPWQ